MSDTASKRNLRGGPFVVSGNQCAKLGDSDLYLVQSSVSELSIIHALLKGISPTYRSMDKECREQAVVSLLDIADKESQGNEKDYIGFRRRELLLKKPAGYDVCIFNLLKRGRTSATMIHKRSTHAPPTKDLCVYVVRVSSTVTYTIAEKMQDGSFNLTIPTNEHIRVGRTLESSTFAMMNANVWMDV